MPNPISPPPSEPIRLRSTSSESVAAASHTVTMSGETVVVDPAGVLDLDATSSLLTLIEAATTCGSPAAILLGAAIERIDHGVHGSGCPMIGARLDASVPLPGYLRIATAAEIWTVDVPRRRLCRSEGQVDPRFVEPHHWADIDLIELNHDRITAHPVDAPTLSAELRWTPIGHRRPAA